MRIVDGGGQCLGGRRWTGSCRSSDAMFWAGAPSGSTFQGTSATRPVRDNLAAATRKQCAARRSSRGNQAAWLGFPLYYALPWTAPSASILAAGPEPQQRRAKGGTRYDLIRWRWPW